MKKEVVIITRYFLPNINVDSDSVYQMIKYLKKLDNDIIIHIVTTESKYKGDTLNYGKYSKELLKLIQIHKIKSLFINPKNSIIKIINDIYEGYKLIFKSRKLNIKNIISLSNPPLISFWHSLLLKKYNFFYWTFDVFPDALVADQILKKDSYIYNFLSKNTYKNAPKTLIALGDFQYDYLINKYKAPINKIILSCGIHDENFDISEKVPLWKNQNVVTIGYVGNIGRAHSPIFLKNIISSIANRTGFKLIISIYGFHKDIILEHLKTIDSNNIQLVDSVDKSHLSLIDIHLVSLMKNWNNISVPSKAVSAICSGGALWYCGDVEVDTWNMFKNSSFKSTDKIEDIDSFFSTFKTQELLEKKQKTIELKSKLRYQEELAYKSLLKLIE